MLNLIDVVIIALALLAALGALFLLRPQADSEEAYRLRKLREKAQQDQKQIADVLNTIQHGAVDAEYLASQLKSRIAQINTEDQGAQTRTEELDRTVKNAKQAESELQSISTQLGSHIQAVQDHWDKQLLSNNDTIKQMKGKLKQSLAQMDEGLLRMREQEKMAQGLTDKLLGQQREYSATQQESMRSCLEVQQQLENMLKESAVALQTIQGQQQQCNSIFEKYSEAVLGLEQQAHDQFADTFRSTDMARQELTQSLQEVREKAEKLREYEAEGSRMGMRIREQFEQVDHLEVERLSKTVDLTDEMCINLQEGLQNARALLSTLEAKTAVVVASEGEGEGESSESESAQKKVNTKSVTEERPRNNLFSLRAYR